MATMNVSLPDTMRNYIEERVSEGGYSTASEYLRELVRNDQKQRAQERLEALMLAGLESGAPIEMTDEYWQKKKADLIARHKAPGTAIE